MSVRQLIKKLQFPYQLRLVAQRCSGPNFGPPEAGLFTAVLCCRTLSRRRLDFSAFITTAGWPRRLRSQPAQFGVIFARQIRIEALPA